MAPSNDRRSRYLMSKPWVVWLACTFVFLLPVPMWLQRQADIADRRGHETRTVTVLEVVEQGNDDLITARVQDRKISFSRPGETSVGDEVEVYQDGGRWRSADDPPLWVPIAATALCWVSVGIVVWRYPILARRRGWM